MIHEFSLALPPHEIYVRNIAGYSAQSSLSSANQLQEFDSFQKVLIIFFGKRGLPITNRWLWWKNQIFPQSTLQHAHNRLLFYSSHDGYNGHENDNGLDC